MLTCTSLGTCIDGLGAVLTFFSVPGAPGAGEESPGRCSEAGFTSGV